MQPEPNNEQSQARNAENRYGWLFCIGCCPPSERWWFRWVLPAQPVVWLLIYLYYRLGGS